MARGRALNGLGWPKALPTPTKLSRIGEGRSGQKEFDPGSERTLAICLTHASRTWLASPSIHVGAEGQEEWLPPSKSVLTHENDMHASGAQQAKWRTGA